MDQIYELLKCDLEIPEHDCKIYLKQFSDHGYDNLKSLFEDIKEEDLISFMKPGHIKRFMKHLHPIYDSPLSYNKLAVPSAKGYSEYFDRYHRSGSLSLQVSKLPERHEPDRAIVYLGEVFIPSYDSDADHIISMMPNPHVSYAYSVPDRQPFTTRERIILLGKIGTGSSSVVYKYLYIPTLFIVAVSTHTVYSHTKYKNTNTYYHTINM